MSFELVAATVYVARVVYPIIITLDILTNAVNIMVLRRPNLKHFACSLYLSVMSGSNIFHAIVGITYNLLLDGYQIDLNQNSRVLCKLMSYILSFCPYMSVYMLVLASIDRYCSSSLNAERRRLSNIQTARKLTLIVSILVTVFMIGNIISFDISADDSIRCGSNGEDLFNQIYLILQVLVYVIIAPFLMMLFGFLTIYNIYKSSRNHNMVFRYRPSERQLTRMLFIQVSVQILLSLPFCVVFFMLILPITFRFTLMFYGLYVLFKTPFYITFITPFFLYILSAQVYRREFIQILKKVVRLQGQGAIHPIIRRQSANGSLPTNPDGAIPPLTDSAM